MSAANTRSQLDAPTFSTRAAFEKGQGSQPDIPFKYVAPPPFFPHVPFDRLTLSFSQPNEHLAHL